MSKPTFVFVNGAWHSPEFFCKVISILEEKGWKCVTVTMPGIGGSPPVANLDKDIAAVRSAVMKELDMENDVIMHAHSWGGIPTCSALDGLSKAERKNIGKSSAVVRLSFASSFVLPEGDGNIMRTDFLEAMYHDVPPEEANNWISKLKPQSLATFEDKTRSAAWKRIPSSYLVCEDDRAIPAQGQDAMIAKAKEAGGDIEVERMFVSHSPYVAKPKETASFLERAAQRSGEV